MAGVRRDRTLNYTGRREPANVSPHRKSAICKPLEPGGERFADFLDGSLILVQIHAYQFLDGELLIFSGREQVGNEFPCCYAVEWASSMTVRSAATTSDDSVPNNILALNNAAFSVSPLRLSCSFLSTFFAAIESCTS